MLALEEGILLLFANTLFLLVWNVAEKHDFMEPESQTQTEAL